MSRPRLKLGPHLARGLPALVLFVIFALGVLGRDLGQLFDSDPLTGADVTEVIGLALLNIEDPNLPGAEGFLPALILLALVLDAALDGAVHLASREDEGSIVTALAADGGSDEHEHGGEQP
jgi:NADH-quinone oxidoreductase subunit J